MPDRFGPMLLRTERICAVIAGMAAIIWALLQAASTARFMGVDDAYYLGIGANILTGRGPATAFGAFAPHHAPLWPMIVEAPAAWWGLDPAAWAHLLVIVAGAATVALSGWFAWRSIRQAAPLAAAVMLAFPFMASLATGLGLDLPAAALSLLYLAIGVTAVRRGSFAMGLAAGVLFACAFLMKEIALPLAPVPVLAGLIRNVPGRQVARVSAGMLFAGLAGTSWWFVLFAQQVGTVYRLGAPAWTLIPIWVGLVAVAAALLVADRWWESVGRNAAVPDSVVRRIGWAGAIAWAILLTIFFARTPTGLGSSFLNPAQVGNNVLTWFPTLAPIVALFVVGGTYAIVRRFRRGDSADIDDILVALLCGLPLILLVVSVGEGPRHYIALLALMVALGSIGVSEIAADLAGVSPRRAALVTAGLLAFAAVVTSPFLVEVVTRSLLVRMAGLGVAAVTLGVVGRAARIDRRLGLDRRGAWVVATVTLLLASAALFDWLGLPHVPYAADRARAASVQAVVSWVRSNVQPGAPVVFSNGLAYETALRLQADYLTRQVRDQAGVHVDASAPLGLGVAGQPPGEDWLALRASPTDVTSLYGYRSGTVEARFAALGNSYWIQSEVLGPGTASPILEALRNASGVSVAASWTWPYGGGRRLETVIFAMDPGHLSFPESVVMDEGALTRILRGLESSPLPARAGAALAARALVVPPSADSAALVDRLRHIGAP